MVRTIFFNVTTKDGITEMLLYGSIGSFNKGISANDFAEKFKALEAKGKPIHLRINSPGGEIYDGMAIFNTIRQSKIDVIVFVDGVAASMASVIALAGKELYMSKIARLMTHKASGGINGDSEDFKNYASHLEDLENTMASIYSRKTGLTIAQAKAKYLRKGFDRWITAAEALKEGIIDGIYDETAQTQQPPKNMQSTSALWEFYSKHLKPHNMFQKFAALLGLDLTASEEEISGAITALLDKNKGNITATAQSMINAMSKRPKFDKTQQQMFTMLAKDNPQFVVEKLTEMLLIPPPAPNIISMIEDANIGQSITSSMDGAKAKKDWNLEDYRKFAPGELTSNPKLYTELLEKAGITE